MPVSDRWICIRWHPLCSNKVKFRGCATPILRQTRVRRHHAPTRWPFTACELYCCPITVSTRQLPVDLTTLKSLGGSGRQRKLYRVNVGTCLHSRIMDCVESVRGAAHPTGWLRIARCQKPSSGGRGSAPTAGLPPSRGRRNLARTYSTTIGSTEIRMIARITKENRSLTIGRPPK